MLLVLIGVIVTLVTRPGDDHLYAVQSNGQVLRVTAPTLDDVVDGEIEDVWFGIFEPLIEMSLDTFEAVMATNVRGAFLMAREAAKSRSTEAPAEVILGRISGIFGLKGDDRISKIKVHKVARWVMDQYEQEGRMSAITDEELEALLEELEG